MNLMQYGKSEPWNVEVFKISYLTLHLSREVIYHQKLSNSQMH